MHRVRIFVAGATGVIGRSLVPLLVAAGHEVMGMTRTSERARELEETGAEPVVCDVFDRSGLREAVAVARPSVVVHELSELPPGIDHYRLREQLAPDARIRREGTRNLVDAAVDAGAQRFVVQSLAFTYAPEGELVKDENARLYDDAPGDWRPTVEASLELERLVGESPLEGVVLRYGYLYGPGTAYASDGACADLVRRRGLPLVGRASGVFSFIHVDDAALATALAVEHGAAGIYNVVDDDPAPLREWLPVYAEALGAKPPRRAPRLLVRLSAGRYAAEYSTEHRGASNARAKEELGWRPRYPSWREGFLAGFG
jgi:nucleoside-diphosphate-sugar epimerase